MAAWRRQGGFDHLLRCIETALTEIGGDRPIRVLEAGCGGGQVLEFLHGRVGDRVELFGFDVIDVSQAITRLTAVYPSIDWRTRVRMVDVNESWPFDAGSVDIVVSHHVLEHVHDLDAFMTEHHRVLRPGGFGVHVFPSSRLLMEPHLDIPFAHWPVSDAGRRQVLNAARRLRIGSQGWRGRGVTAQLEYLRTSTRFRTYQQVIRAGREAGLQVAAGPTLRYGLELMRAVRKRGLASLQAEPARPVRGFLKGSRGRTSTAIGQWFLPVTLLTRRPHETARSA